MADDDTTLPWNGRLLIRFRAGMIFRRGSQFLANRRSGWFFLYETTAGQLRHCWKDNATGIMENDMALTRGSAEFVHVPDCISHRVYALNVHTTKETHLFWMQEPDAANDRELCRMVNSFLNNGHHNQNQRTPVPGTENESSSSPMNRMRRLLPSFLKKFRLSNAMSHRTRSHRTQKSSLNSAAQEGEKNGESSDDFPGHMATTLHADDKAKESRRSDQTAGLTTECSGDLDKAHEEYMKKRAEIYMPLAPNEDDRSPGPVGRVNVNPVQPNLPDYEKLVPLGSDYEFGVRVKRTNGGYVRVEDDEDDMKLFEDHIIDDEQMRKSNIQEKPLGTNGRNFQGKNSRETNKEAKSSRSTSEMTSTYATEEAHGQAHPKAQQLREEREGATCGKGRRKKQKEASNLADLHRFILMNIGEDDNPFTAEKSVTKIPKDVKKNRTENLNSHMHQSGLFPTMVIAFPQMLANRKYEGKDKSTHASSTNTATDKREASSSERALFPGSLPSKGKQQNISMRNDSSSYSTSTGGKNRSPAKIPANKDARPAGAQANATGRTDKTDAQSIKDLIHFTEEMKNILSWHLSPGSALQIHENRESSTDKDTATTSNPDEGQKKPECSRTGQDTKNENSKKQKESGGRKNEEKKGKNDGEKRKPDNGSGRD